MKNIAVYGGTFDPITLGHVDIVERASRLFDKIIVAVAVNVGKNPLFSLKERVALAEEVLSAYKNVEVKGFESLLTDFALQCGANIILRGIRVVSDFDYEFQLAGMNRYLAPKLESMFLMPAEHFTCISARLVREISQLGGDVKQFVPECVAVALNKKHR